MESSLRMIVIHLLFISISVVSVNSDKIGAIEEYKVLPEHATHLFKVNRVDAEVQYEANQPKGARIITKDQTNLASDTTRLFIQIPGNERVFLHGIKIAGIYGKKKLRNKFHPMKSQ